jgi:L-threonylcarbamoyladenylate synthase
MEILTCDDHDIERAAAAITAGLLVAFPTETVYGLGADAFNPAALARIFEAKNRPRFDPLIIHIAEPDALFRIADVSALGGTAAKKLSLLSKSLWPGPLTLILPKRAEVPELATAGLATAAVRFPSHQAARKLILLSTGAVAAPSANPFGCLSPTRAGHVKAQLGEKVDFIIDGGRTLVGIESAVLDLSRDPPRILRPGGTTREAIEALIGPVECCTELPADSAEAPLSPGLLKSHYAPRTPLVLCRRGELASLPDAPREGRLYFSPPEGAANGNTALYGTKILSEKGILREAAANLFDMLHELDSLNLDLIRAEEAPSHGLGIAINDRLRRAAGDLPQ